MDLLIKHEKGCYQIGTGQQGSLWVVHRGRREGQGCNSACHTRALADTEAETQEVHGSLSIRILRAGVGYCECRFVGLSMRWVGLSCLEHHLLEVQD